MSRGKLQIFAAPWLLPVSTPPLRDGAVALRDGRIAAVGPRDQVVGAAPESTVRDLEDCVLLPGLVNPHLHLEYTLWAGLLDHRPYLPWIQALVRSKLAATDDDDLRVSARLGARELVQAGVTTVGEQTARGVSVEALSELGLQGVAYLECFGRHEEEIDRSLALLPDRLAIAEENAGPGLRIGLTPHTPWTSGPRLIEGVARLARKRGAPLAIHAAESPDETAFLREGRGPIARLWRGEGLTWDATGLSPVAWLDRLGFWDGPTPVQAVHLVQADREDWRRLDRRGAAAVLCPRSNAALEVGPCPIDAAQAGELPVGLGTDSRASSASLDPRDEARAALRAARASGQRLSTATALSWITSEAAASLGLADRGALEAGRRGDLSAFQLDEPKTEDPAADLLEGRSSRRAWCVVTGGRTLVREGRLQQTRAPDPAPLHSRGEAIRAALRRTLEDDDA